MPRRTGHCQLSARPCSRRLAPLSSGEPVNGVARHCFAVTHWSRQHLIDEHISRFNADADDPGHLPNHGVVPGLRLLLQPQLGTGVLDLPDLADDKAQPRAMSRCSSANTFGGSGMPSGVRTVARRSAALCRVGLKLRTPTGQLGLHSVDDARTFPDQALALRFGRLASSSTPSALATSLCDRWLPQR